MIIYDIILIIIRTCVCKDPRYTSISSGIDLLIVLIVRFCCSQLSHAISISDHSHWDTMFYQASLICHRVSVNMCILRASDRWFVRHVPQEVVVESYFEGFKIIN